MRVSKSAAGSAGEAVGHGRSGRSETLSEKVYEGLGSDAMRKRTMGEQYSDSKSINLDSEERRGNSGPEFLCFANYYMPVIIVGTKNAKMRHQQMAEAEV